MFAPHTYKTQRKTRGSPSTAMSPSQNKLKPPRWKGPAHPNVQRQARPQHTSKFGGRARHQDETDREHPFSSLSDRVCGSPRFVFLTMIVSLKSISMLITVKHVVYPQPGEVTHPEWKLLPRTAQSRYGCSCRQQRRRLLSRQYPFTERRSDFSYSSGWSNHNDAKTSWRT